MLIAPVDMSLLQWHVLIMRHMAPGKQECTATKQQHVVQPSQYYIASFATHTYSHLSGITQT